MTPEGAKFLLRLTEALSARGWHDDYDDGDEADKRDEGKAAGELHETSKSGSSNFDRVNDGCLSCLHPGASVSPRSKESSFGVLLWLVYLYQRSRRSVERVPARESVAIS